MNKINFVKGFKSGFTLIELLVVVAIIGILASVVLANLNGARRKGIDAAIKAGLSNARAQAALFYDDNQVYTDVCINAGGINPLVLSASQRLNTLAVVGDNIAPFVYDETGLDPGSAVCHDSDTDWAAIVSLKDPVTPFAGWCVDSAGASMETTHLNAGEFACTP